MSDGPGHGFDSVEGAGDDDHGQPGGEFAAVVFDEAFVRAALVHEPSARERSLSGPTRVPVVDYPDDSDDDPDGLPLELRPLPYETDHVGGWHRMIARVMLVVIGVVAVMAAAAAVYRASGGSGAPATHQSPAPTAPSAPGNQNTPTGESTVLAHS
ncbi:hypothetical protein [Streptacidiphilus jiangxiensis]|uniref:Uncharacterized protein n=1 Tax=Streptacidiphilus jiangxiensis TaxID=235985 RepID=A0A1H7S950_STRJI|nr:hypothetical protein [Streptacidiphilus jiangxiensis]SEL68274.1 hypothetical protein SAMN05414137_111193 [Streptacidiphilus jiangxiensis]